MKSRRPDSLVYLVLALTLLGSVSSRAEKLIRPPSGMYEGVFPDLPDTPTPVWEERIQAYETLIGKKVAWATIMADFVDGLGFPMDAVNQVNQAGTIPFIRILPRSQRVQGQGPETVYRLDLIAAGNFDPQLKKWCDDAHSVKGPLLVEFAQEANGDWYGWGGALNGAGAHTLSPTIPDGPFKFQEAYRHLVTLCRQEGADNITWFFHLDSQPIPRDEDWNKMANYYPGDDYVDWIGLSVYGAQYPTDYWATFNETLEPAYRELAAVTINKPMAVLEMGVIENPKDPNGKAQWLTDALVALMTDQYPRIHGLNYWHESSWVPAGDNNFRVDSSPQALQAFRSLIQLPDFIGNSVFQ